MGQADSLSLLYLQAATKNSTTSLAIKNQFENALVDFIRSIRQRAYPIYFDPKSGLENDDHEVVPEIAARDHSSVIPIYILPPFHSTDMMAVIRSAIRRVILAQDEGYRGSSECCIYDVDVGAWMSTVDGSLESWNFHPSSLNGTQQGSIEAWRLTSMGHTRVAAYLESRLCRYLALEPRLNCPNQGEGEVGGTMGYVQSPVNPEGARIEREKRMSKEMRLKGSFVW